MFPHRLWIAAAIAAAAWLAPLANAHAQGTGGTGGSTTSPGNVRVALISIGDEEVETVGTIYLNRKQCLDNDELLFKVDGVPQGKVNIDIYSGDSCNQKGNRDNTTNLSCNYLTSSPTGGVTLGLMLHIKAQDLIDDCEVADESKPKLWFIPVDQKMSPMDVGNNYGTLLRLQIDTALPTPPVNVKGGEGENTIPVSWSGGQTNLKGFKIYVDPNAGKPGSSVDNDGTSGSNAGTADAGKNSVDASTGVIDTSSVDGGVLTDAPNPSCPSSVLVGGSNADNVPSSVHKKTLDEPNATGTDLSPSQIGGTHAAMAVVAVDLAGNESALSNVECVDVVVTQSFWDRYQENGGDTKEGCPCSATGTAQLQGAWPVGLVLLGLALSARRRRSS